jgi:DNA-binding transcriptional ArsR family regulator
VRAPVAFVYCIHVYYLGQPVQDRRDQMKSRSSGSHAEIVSINDADDRASCIAAAIGVPARAKMLYALADGRARTSTELAILADVTPGTASVHLRRLLRRELVTMFAQGKHRYYSLRGTDVAAALEALSVIAGSPRGVIGPRTPRHLRNARTCYDHIAGALGVALHDRFMALRWLSESSTNVADYDLTADGTGALHALGIDVDAARAARRRFAFACIDWSERRPHLAGALGAAMLARLIRLKWVTPELDGRALSVTRFGRREMSARLGLAMDSVLTE